MRRKRSHRKLRIKTFVNQGFACYYCGKPTIFRDWTIEHQQPISRGGTNNNHTNLVGSCKNCNKAKGNMTEEEFLLTDYLSNERRAILGYTCPPLIAFNKAKKSHNLRLNPNYRMFEGLTEKEVIASI